MEGITKEGRYIQTLNSMDDLLKRTVENLRKREEEVELYQGLFFELLDHNLELQKRIDGLEKQCLNRA